MTNPGFVGSHNRLLEQVDDQVDRTQSRLDSGIKRMKDFIVANSDLKQQWVIIGLVVVLIVLLVIVIMV